MLFDIISKIAALIVTLILLGTHKYLSTRKKWQLGGVVPIAFAAITGILFYVRNVPSPANVISTCVFLTAMELFIWADWSMKYRKKEV